MKRALVPLVLVLGLAGLLVYQLVNQGAVECRVCVTFSGQTKCASARGETDREAQREAQSSACSLITSGVSEAFACPNQQPDQVECGVP